MGGHTPVVAFWTQTLRLLFHYEQNVGIEKDNGEVKQGFNKSQPCPTRK
jgi:hypothetical protein